MNYAVINLALAVLLFVTAFLVFDRGDWTQMAISAVLFLSGLHSLFMDSESVSRRRFAKSCLRLAVVIAVVVIAKLLIFG